MIQKPYNPTHFKLPLVARVDSKGDEYYIGSFNYDFPVLVDLSSVDFLVFHPVEDQDSSPDKRSYATLVLRAGRREG